MRITYPGFLGWWKTFDDGLHDGTVPKKIDRYRFVKGAHERWITKILNRFLRYLTGQALMAEVQRAKHTVSIFPQKGNSDAGEIPDHEVPGTEKDELLRDSHGAAKSPKLKGTGLGSDAEIQFSPGKWSRLVGSSGLHGPGANADEVLFHEMVHSSRDLNGKASLIAVNKKFDNEEEFLAIVIDNIYLSEKGQTDLVRNHSFQDQPKALRHPEKFLDDPTINPKPRVLLERFRKRQHLFFQSLATIKPAAAKFNPVRQFNDEVLAWYANRRRKP